MGNSVNEWAEKHGFAKLRHEVFPPEAVKHDKAWDPEKLGKAGDTEPYLMWPVLLTSLTRHGLPASHAVILMAMLWRAGIKLERRIKRTAIITELGFSFHWFRKAVYEMHQFGVVYNASPGQYEMLVKFYPYDRMMAGVVAMVEAKAAAAKAKKDAKK
jgi:hypothetical protein